MSPNFTYFLFFLNKIGLFHIWHISIVSLLNSIQPSFIDFSVIFKEHRNTFGLTTQYENYEALITAFICLHGFLQLPWPMPHPSQLKVIITLNSVFPSLVFFFSVYSFTTIRIL